MYGLMVSLAFALAPASPDDAASKELAALAQKVKDAESYSFTFLPARQEQEKAKDASSWKVEIKKKLPYHYQRGDVDFFKLDEKFVLKGTDGKWTLADPSKLAGGPMPKVGGTTDPKGGGEGGDDGKQPGPAKKGEGHARRSGIDRIVSASEGIPLPHRLFSDFDAKFAEVTKEEKDGLSVFHAKLKPAFVRELMNARKQGGHAGGGGGEGKGEGKPAGGGAEGGDAAAPKRDSETTGSMNITAKGDVIETIDFEVAIRLPSTERKGGGTITLSNLNATNLVVPKEVETALGIGAAPEKK